MRRHPVAYPCVVLAVLLAASGCSSTPAERPTPVGTTATGNVHLTDYADNDGPTSTVILSGAVGDYGKAQSVNPDGSVNPEHNSQLNLMLAHGSFRLSIAELDKRFVAAVAGLRVDTTTCSGTASASSPVPIVPDSGTGSYKGIRGTFTLTITLDEVDQPAGCSASSPLLAQAIVITGSGPVSVG
jgi:hypothetical protein